MDKITKIKELTAELLCHCHFYYDLDSPKISDAEYDKRFDTLKQLEDEANFWLANSPTRKVQGEVLPYLEKVHHSVPMLSADKSTDIEDVIKFINNKVVVTTYKFDGGTVVVKYQNGNLVQGLSRGSGYDGEDITHTVRMIKNLPLTIPYKGNLEIRGEALIPWREYNEMNIDGTMGHPRNVCTGALRQLNANEASKRNIYFYAFTLVNWKEVGVKTKSESLGFLSCCGFDISPYMVCNPHKQDMSLKEQVECAIAFLNREAYINPTDGWCFEFEDLEYGESLGSTEHHDRKLYALKPQRTDYPTRFRGVEYKTCRTGVVSLTAVFDPVEIDNTIVTKATLHNVDYFNNLELGEGDEVVTAKMNEIIPAVLDNKTRSNTYKLIDECPSCKAKLIIKNTGTANVLYCPNEDCPSRSLAKFTHFVSKNCVDIRGLSEKTLEQLISAEFLHTYRDIYHLSEHKDKLVLLEGLGEKSVSTLLKSIEKSRDIKLENFIAALGIDGVGKSAAKTIADAFDGDFWKLIDGFNSGFDFAILTDIGDKTARNIIKYLAENEAEICVLAQEFNFIFPKKIEVKENPLKGIKFCITGSFSQSRDKLKEQLEAKGAKFVSSVSKNLDILFCGEKAGSKLTKAQGLGVKVAYEDKLMEMLED
jgi:DNA ligase (NAD+)